MTKDIAKADSQRLSSLRNSRDPARSGANGEPSKRARTTPTEDTKPTKVPNRLWSHESEGILILVRDILLEIQSEGTLWGTDIPKWKEISKRLTERYDINDKGWRAVKNY